MVKLHFTFPTFSEMERVFGAYCPPDLPLTVILEDGVLYRRLILQTLSRAQQPIKCGWKKRFS